MTAPPVLEMRGISKRYAGVVANDGVNFDVRAAEVHTLLGENGAGKSTLMKILYGLARADEGEIRWRGKPTRIANPATAISLGIGMVHQHFMLVPSMSVAENVALGLSSTARGGRDFRRVVPRRVVERIREVSDRFGLEVDPFKTVAQLSVGERQRVEILKALYRDASLLILDEPTAVLTPQEVDDLFEVLRGYVAGGSSIVFISHKMREVLSLSDRITVMRMGRVVASADPRSVTRHDLARLMVGRELQDVRVPTGDEAGDVRLAIRSLHVPGDRTETGVRCIDLDVRSGEIVGVAGVSGNGQRELAEAIAGLRPVESGSIHLDGEDVTACDPCEMRGRGLAYVPEERMVDGVVGDFSVADNLMLVSSRDSDFSRWGLVSTKRVHERCRELVDRFAIKTPSLGASVRTLSGGNIQKVVLARELATQPKVLVAANPTGGVDLGACQNIHGCLVEERARGTAVLLISEDLDEILTLADRIAVLYEGSIIGILERGASREQVGLMMAGVLPDQQPVGRS